MQPSPTLTVDYEPGTRPLAGPATLDVSVVVPLLDERESIEELTGKIEASLQGRSFEIILVDDGSSDGSWNEIGRLASARHWLRGISLQRNYGKSTALQCGFDHARGERIVTLDADLQDDPNEIPALLDRLDQGYDLVSGWKKNRQDPIQKTIPSRFFNWVTRLMTGIPLHDFNCGLKVYRREVIQSIELYGELHRYIPLLADREGFSRISEQKVRHHARKYGQTKFGLSRFLYGFLDLLTLLLVRRFVTRPMHFFGSIGILSLLVGSAINLHLFWIKVVHQASLSNRPLLILGVLLVVIGVQFFSIGFLGEMMQQDRTTRKPVRIRDQV
ncbi:MAG: glycosyltransferase family 2 protein [Balneolaceae bacterium]